MVELVQNEGANKLFSSSYMSLFHPFLKHTFAMRSLWFELEMLYLFALKLQDLMLVLIISIPFSLWQQVLWDCNLMRTLGGGEGLYYSSGWHFERVCGIMTQQRKALVKWRNLIGSTWARSPTPHPSVELGPFCLALACAALAVISKAWRSLRGKSHKH